MASAPTITIFGATGFLGRAFLRSLTRASVPTGTKLRLVSRGKTSRRYKIPIPYPPTTEHVECDITSRVSVQNALAGTTHAVNLVGILYETPGTSSTFSAVQAEAPALMSEAAIKNGVKSFVHVSAIGADSNSASEYARTKKAGEDAFVPLAQSTDCAVTILRPSIVFGPEDSFFNKFNAISRISPVLPLVGGGGTLFQPVHVDDVAQAIVKSLRLGIGAEAEPSTQENSTPAESNQSTLYELGGGTVLTFRQIMELLLQVTGKRRALVPLPFSAARAQGLLFEAAHRMVPAFSPLLTRDQVTLLERDNVVSLGAKTLKDLGIYAQPCNEVTVSYLR